MYGIISNWILCGTAKLVQSTGTPCGRIDIKRGVCAFLSLGFFQQIPVSKQSTPAVFKHQSQAGEKVLLQYTRMLELD